MVATNLTTDVASAMTTSQQRRRTYNHHADRAPQSATFELEPFLPYRLNVRTATVSEALAWIYYFRFGEITAQAISSHAMMHKTKVSRVVTVLAAREVIERRAIRANKREPILCLLPEGERIYRDLIPRALAFTTELETVLSPADRRALDAMLLKLTAHACVLGVAQTLPSKTRKATSR